jgi:Calx-beta domain/Fibronectin type III domain
MDSMRRGRRAVGTLTLITALAGSAVLGLASTSQAASASASAATTAVTAPGISAPPDVVVGAASGPVHLNVTLSAPGIDQVTVNYTTANGTTDSGSSCQSNFYSYVGQQGTLTFNPGVTSQTVTVPLLNCGISLTSGFQEFTLNLSGNSTDSTLVRARTQIDITGNAPATSTPGLYVRDAVVDNTAGTINVPVLLGGPSGAASGLKVSVPYTTHDGTAVAGTDYTTTSGILTFLAGQTAENITVPIKDRSGSAPARSFSVTLGTPTNAKIADGTGVVTIGASGGGKVTAPGISAPADVVAGASDGYIDLPVTLSAPGINPVTVNYTTANGTTDSSSGCQSTFYSYLGYSGTLTFQPGVTLQAIRIPLLSCGISLTSGFQEFTLNLSGNSTDSTLVRARTQIDITGNAPATYTPGLYVRGAVVDQTAGTISVPVLLGGPSGAAPGSAVTVPYTTNDGSAVAGTDYTTTSGTLVFPPGETAQNITVPILDRTGSAPARSFSVTLGTPAHAKIADGTGIITIGASGGGKVTAPGISAPADVVTGATDGYIDLPVTLSAPGINPVTVNYTTANGTTDSSSGCQSTFYSYLGYSGTLTFQPGVTTQAVRIPLLNCGISLTSGFQEFTLNLSGNSTDSTLVRARTQIDITGNAPATSTPGLYVRDAAVDNSAGTINVPVLLGGPSGAAPGSPVSVPYTTNDGSAVAGTDYTTTSGTLVFPPGETAQNITVPILDRTGSAPARSFSVTLGTPAHAKIADGTGIITIGASGSTKVTAPKISASPDTEVSQVDGYVDLPVTLSAPGINPVTVNYTTANGTTDSSSGCQSTFYSYLGYSGTLTFQPGVTLQTVRIPLLSCGQTAKGTFYLNLSGNSSDSTIIRAQTLITIVPKAVDPGAPTKVTAVAGDSSAMVSFVAPASDGGSDINSYTVTASPGGATASGIASPITISGLTNGTAYAFTVTATNAHGTGPASLPSSPVTPA